MFKYTSLTYNEFIDGLLKFEIVRRSGSKRIDSVFNVYCENSIKMLKEEIALLVNYSLKILLAYLKLSDGVPFSQIETIKQSWFDFWCHDRKDKLWSLETQSYMLLLMSNSFARRLMVPASQLKILRAIKKRPTPECCYINDIYVLHLEMLSFIRLKLIYLSSSRHIYWNFK